MDDGKPAPLTLEECRALHEDWSITVHGEDVHCRKPPFHFKAADPGDAHREIERRETPWAVG